MEQCSAQWPCSAQSYEKLVKIEAGKFGEVWSSICKSSGKKFCLKILELDQVDTSLEQLLLEVQAMRLTDDPNILKCYCSFVHTDQLWIITRFMNKGSCQRVLRIAQQQTGLYGLDEDCLGYILSETLKGIQYLHQRGITHRHVRCENILLDDSGDVRLADCGSQGSSSETPLTVSPAPVLPSSGVANNGFNISNIQSTTQSLLGIAQQGDSYASEMCADGGQYENRVDIIMLGETALAMCRRETPSSVSSEDTESKIGSTLSLFSPETTTSANYSKFFDEFLLRCLQKTPKLRPSAAELQKHKFLRGRSSSALIHFLKPIYNVDSEEAEQELLHMSSSCSDPADGRQSASGSASPMKRRPSAVVAQGSQSPNGLSNPSSPAKPPVIPRCDNEETSESSVSAPTHLSLQDIDEREGSSSEFAPGTSWVFDIDKSVALGPAFTAARMAES